MKKTSQLDLIDFPVLLENLGFGFWLWNSDLEEFFLSDLCQQLLQLDDKSLSFHGSKIKKFFHKDDFYTFLRALSSSKDSFSIDLRLYPKDHNVHWVNLSGMIDRDRCGNIIQVKGLVQNITSRKKKEIEREVSYSRYQLVLEATKDGVWDWDDITKDEVYWSPQLKKMLGYKEDEVEGSAELFFSALHPDDVFLVQQAIEKMIKNKIPFDVEYRVKVRNEGYRWFHAKAALRVDQKTGKQGMSGLLYDIQKRKDTQKALHESEYTKQAFIESSYDGYWDWYLKKDFEYMSPRFWQMFGYDPTLKKHHPSEWQSIITEKSLKVALDNFDKHIQTKGQFPFSQEVEYVHKDGSPVYVLCRGRVVEWDDDGTPVRMIGTHTDISSLKCFEKKILIQNQYLELSESVASVGHWRVDDSTKYLEVSKEVFRICELDYSQTQLSIQTLANCYHPDDRKEVIHYFTSAIESKQPFEFSLRVITSLNEIKYIFCKGQVIEENDQHLIFGVMQDITEHQKTIEKLRLINQELDEFTYIVSHDMKEPLRGLNAYSSFLLRDYKNNLDESGIKKLESIKNLSVRIEKLMDELLHYSKVSRQSIESESVNLNCILEDIIILLEHTLAEKNVNLKISKKLPVVQGSKVLIQELFTNLIVNAIKFNEKDLKEIEIGYIEKTINQYVIFVRDNGIGMESKNLQSIFQIFKRLHPKNKYAGGTGFGLTIVKKIVEQHQGEIWCESELNKGTTFYFTLNNIEIVKSFKLCD